MAVRKEGHLLKYHCLTGNFHVARILPKANYAIYDVHTDHRVTDAKEVQKQNVLSINSVYKFAITKGAEQLKLK